MELKDYLDNQFIHDLRKIHMSRPNSVIQNNPESFKLDEYTVFFGGRNWENCKEDLSEISKENIDYFILSLFTIITIDLNMNTHFNSLYDQFRKKTMYPKFGWSGFGPHFENPKKILNIPLKEGLVDYSRLKSNNNAYVELFHQTADTFFSQNISEIDTKSFFTALLDDTDFQLKDEDKGSFFETIYNDLKKFIETK